MEGLGEVVGEAVVGMLIIGIVAGALLCGLGVIVWRLLVDHVSVAIH